jgi:hypothetical protein
MKTQRKLTLVTVLFAMLATATLAQTPASTTTRSTTTNRKQSKKIATPSVQEQIRELREDLQGQIDVLKEKLTAKDSQIEALQAMHQNTEAKTTTAAAQIQTIDNTVQQNAAAVGTLQASVTDLRTDTIAVSSSVQQVKQTQEKLRKSLDEPDAIRYKGVAIVPGGFIAGESIWRQRAMNADIYTNFNATPYMNSGEAHTSEWVPSARASRFSTLFSGKVPFGTLNGFLETDFLSAGTTSNNLQSNSYTLRVRQAWGQATFDSMKFTGGQMWTLLAENKKSTDAGQEAVPLIFDQNLHVGATYLRQASFRFQDAITPKITLAAAIENSQYQFSASNAPSNFFFGSAGAAGGLDNPSANYTNQVAPDILVKAAFDPGHGHYEIGGVVRFFRSRFYPDGTTSVGAQNDTRVGGGFVASARFPVIPKLDLGLHLVAGDGTGRYGAALLPDITVRPNGTLVPLRNAQGLLSLEYHPLTKLDIFGYVGSEYVQRTYYISSTGTLVGYAPPSGNNSGCDVEAVPTAGTGYAPGASPCLGATRAISQYSVGWVYRIYNGPAGKLQYGAAYSYLTRNGWTGVGGAPKATNNMVYTSFRYYIP